MSPEGPSALAATPPFRAGVSGHRRRQEKQVGVGGWAQALSEVGLGVVGV